MFVFVSLLTSFERNLQDDQLPFVISSTEADNSVEKTLQTMTEGDPSDSDELLIFH